MDVLAFRRTHHRAMRIIGTTFFTIGGLALYYGLVSLFWVVHMPTKQWRAKHNYWDWVWSWVWIPGLSILVLAACIALIGAIWWLSLFFFKPWKEVDDF